MAFDKGNKLWKLRSKHGRDKLFDNPDLLWEAALEYFQWCDDNPIMVHDFIGKEGRSDYREKHRPYTIAGFCIYIDSSREWWNKFKDRASSDFLQVLTRIEEIMYQNKFDGATVGIFNANIIARDLGLAEKSESKVTVEQPLFGDDDED